MASLTAIFPGLHWPRGQSCAPSGFLPIPSPRFASPPRTHGPQDPTRSHLPDALSSLVSQPPLLYGSATPLPRHVCPLLLAVRHSSDGLPFQPGETAPSSTCCPPCPPPPRGRAYSRNLVMYSRLQRDQVRGAVSYRSCGDMMKGCFPTGSQSLPLPSC